jgi:drug/metabolite transporter (DMT)-like permease
VAARPTDSPARHVAPLAVGAALLAIYFIWGSTYLGIRIAVETIPPFLMASIRFLIAGAALYLWSCLRAGTILQPTRREWRDSAIVGAALLGGGMGLVAWGEQTVSSGIAALLVALMPAWVAIFGRVIFGDRLPRLVLLGIAVGLVGVALLAWPTDSGRVDPAGLIALLISPMSWALGSLYSAKRAQLPSLPLLATAMQMLVGGAVLGAAGTLTGELGQLHVDAISSDSLAALTYLVLIGSFIGYTCYVWLLRSAPLALISTYAYVNPVVAFILGALILSEPITPRTLLASAVIVGAVALIVTGRAIARPGRATRASAETIDPTASGVMTGEA